LDITITSQIFHSKIKIIKNEEDREAKVRKVKEHHGRKVAKFILRLELIKILQILHVKMEAKMINNF
jgi:hypothetical protein